MLSSPEVQYEGSVSGVLVELQRSQMFKRNEHVMIGESVKPVECDARCSMTMIKVLVSHT